MARQLIEPGATRLTADRMRFGLVQIQFTARYRSNRVRAKDARL